MRTMLLRKLDRSTERMEVNLLLNLRRKRDSFRRVKRQMQLKEDILQTHQAQPYRSPLSVGTRRLRNRIVVNIDNAIEHRNRDTHSRAKLFKIERRLAIGPGSDMPRQINRA